jgi:hypothetical protein
VRLALVALLGCATPSHRLAPTVPLTGVRDDGVHARVVELVPPDSYRAGRVVVELSNPTPRSVRIASSRLEFVGLRTPVTPGSHAWPTSGGGAGALGGSGLGTSGGSSVGSSGSSGSSGSWGGGALGGGAGLLLGAVLLAPVLVPMLVDGAKAASYDHDAPDELPPGARARFDVAITPPSEGTEQHLTLGTALDDGRRALDVPVIDPRVAHGGWRPHRRIEHVAVRIGGGPFVGDGRYSGTGGIETLAGGAIGPVHVRVSAMGGLCWAGGLEIATAHAIGPLVIAPSIGGQVGWALVGDTRFVGATLGVDLTLPVEHRDVLGLSLVGQRMGIYGKAGPVWTPDDGRLTRWEVGLSIR